MGREDDRRMEARRDAARLEQRRLDERREFYRREDERVERRRLEHQRDAREAQEQSDLRDQRAPGPGAKPVRRFRRCVRRRRALPSDDR